MQHEFDESGDANTIIGYFLYRVNYFNAIFFTDVLAAAKKIWVFFTSLLYLIFLSLA